ncbi:MAG: dicarboxylate/amino acid:cation symporter [Gemmatimonadota bacterium]|nr:dicarboxylate/amino acid:cation symporter [Gemmatimonadota bacterium]
MSLTTRVLLALVAGLGMGMIIASSSSPALHAIPGYLEPLGTMWVNALRMIVVPLVVTSIVIGVNSLPDARTIGRIGARGLGLALLMLATAATFATVGGRVAMSFLTIDASASAALRASATTSTGAAVQGAQKIVGFSQWLVDLVPSNPIKAMADGAMLPIIVFTLLFAMAITRIAHEDRTSILRLMLGIYEASLMMMHWVMLLAPIGVFALTIPLAQRLGLAAAGAVLYYVTVVALFCVAFMALLYVAAWLVGGKDLRTFARACAPAQAVAVSARSSLVTLPVMLEASDHVLHLPLAVRSFFLPLAAATFKCGSAVMIPIGVLFMARLYGVDVTTTQLVTIALVTVVTTFSVPSVPGGTIIVIVPVLLAADLPVAAVGLLLGVDTIPDMIRTATHCTAQMASATILGRFEERAASA